MDLELYPQRLRLFIQWQNYSPYPPIEEYSEIVVEFDRFTWENLPNTVLKKKGILECFHKKPKMKSAYTILDSSYSTIGKLSEPIFQDMFWTSFLLTPTTSNAFSLGRLYSIKSWLIQQIHVIEIDTGREVEFLLALYINENDGIVDYLKERPTHISLRGPYWINQGCK